MRMRSETRYYESIAASLESLLRSELRNNDIEMEWRIGEFSKGLREISKKWGSKEVRILAEKCSELNLDIFFVARKKPNNNICLLILEVKAVGAVGLSDFSQLVGYMMVSGAQLGLLVNVDGRMSSRLGDVLGDYLELTNIVRLVGDKRIEHKIGVFYFDTATRRFRYSSRGPILNVPKLAEMIKEIIG